MPIRVWNDVPSRTETYPMVRLNIAPAYELNLILELRQEFGWGLKEAKNAVKMGVVFDATGEGALALLDFIGKSTKFYTKFNSAPINFTIGLARWEEPPRSTAPVRVRGHDLTKPT